MKIRSSPLGGSPRSCGIGPSPAKAAPPAVSPGPVLEGVVLRDLRSDVGLGLMIGRNRLTTRPLRIDLAYAFNPPPGRSRWQVSMGVQFSFVD